MLTFVLRQCFQAGEKVGVKEEKKHVGKINKQGRKIFVTGLQTYSSEGFFWVGRVLPFPFESKIIFLPEVVADFRLSLDNLVSIKQFLFLNCSFSIFFYKSIKLFSRPLTSGFGRRRVAWFGFFGGVFLLLFVFLGLGCLD